MLMRYTHPRPETIAIKLATSAPSPRQLSAKNGTVQGI
jgi:hypothetical protein